LSSIVPDIVIEGDIVRVDCGKMGAFVVMYEPEYEFLWNAVYFLHSGELPVETLRRFEPKE